LRFIGLLLLGVLVLSGCTYGPVVDRSGVRSAVLLPGGQGVGVAYQILRYRPATGIAAFPDGGIPRYLEDRILIAVLPPYGPPRVLQRLENRGVDGAASVTLRAAEADPGHLLVLYGEQPSTAEVSRLRMWRLEIGGGAERPIPDLARELKAEGRELGSSEFGDVRVIAADGTLLIGAEGRTGPSSGSGGRARRCGASTA
jgi:hypothetical protein